jgi:hypothetical protein
MHVILAGDFDVALDSSAAADPCLQVRWLARACRVSAADARQAGGAAMSSDAIVILKADHKEIRGLFRRCPAAGDKAVKTKGRLAGQMIELLTVHTQPSAVKKTIDAVIA